MAGSCLATASPLGASAVPPFTEKTIRDRGLPFPLVRRVFEEDRPLELYLGGELGPIDVAYHTYGQLDESGTNAILVCHAMTGDAYVARPTGASTDLPEGWWESIIGPGRPLDTNKYFVVCSNILGSCYGTTGPTSLNPRTGCPYGPEFPSITVRDMVRVQKALLDQLGVNRLALVIGGSLGGMQVLEWALLFPERVEAIAPIATVARHTDWAIALNEVARLAITSDPAFQAGAYREQPERGLALARMMAMLSYRHYESYNSNFDRKPDRREKTFADPFGSNRDFAVESYLRYQGRKLVNRFDANSYIAISRAMDAHDIARDRGTLAEVLASIRLETLCVGIDSDLLYPASDQRALADTIPGASYGEIRSIHGHDAFLIEFDQFQAILKPFLEELGS
ncbi:homoserine O-acetyltransferase [Sulfidibacter corallicola]|uniref:Homoserine O-acetyltransferase n=1 Tax=Sulfidibacter corallicola TaxID=2818388 RepID=A0A8A4TRJ2_SULCO|nr:homoserine O-acetyltransferase [Sulfidibacter corallicola]QTD52170.1 homoserine O-acetyltransferase [Sulfidibacter corallicola]